MGASLVVAPAASLAFQKVDAQFHSVASGSGPKFTLLSWESLALLGLVSGTRLNFFAAALGFGWTGLLENGVVIACQLFMNSIISFFNDG